MLKAGDEEGGHGGHVQRPGKADFDSSECGVRSVEFRLCTPAIEDLFCGCLREVRIDLPELIHLLFGSLHPFDIFSKPLFTGGDDIAMGMGNWGIGKLANWGIGELGNW